MTTNYPSVLDTVVELKNDAADPTITSLTHPQAHNNASDAVIAIETELGVNPSGGSSDVVARVATLVNKSPGANQTIQSSGNFIPLILRASASHSAARLMEIQASNGATLGYWNHQGYLSASSFKINGVALASTHLSDTTNILLNPSPSITSPTITSPTLTSTPTAPTAAVDTNTTQVATTAFVKNQGYIPLDSPTLTGTPTAPTPSVNDDSTKIATTAYVIAQIAEQGQSAEPLGSVVAYGGTSAPSGWLLCDGTAISRTTYSDLFDIIGETYGIGDGSTTFNIPDMQGRAPVGVGSHTSVNALGENDGQATVASRRPKHAHTFSLSTGGASHSHSYSSSSDGSHSHSVTGATGSTGGGGVPSAGGSVYTSTGTGSGGSHSHSGSINSNGGHGHNLSGGVGTSGGLTDGPCYVVVNYIIKVEA